MPKIYAAIVLPLNRIHRMSVLTSSCCVSSIRRGEDMRVIQLGACAHEQIIRFGCIEYHIDGFRRRTANRTRGQTGVLVRIIGRFNRKMAI